MATSISAEAVGGSIDGATGPDRKNERATAMRQMTGMQLHEKKKEERALRLTGDDGHVFQTRLENSYWALHDQGTRHEGLLLNPYIFEVEGDELHLEHRAA